MISFADFEMEARRAAPFGLFGRSDRAASCRCPGPARSGAPRAAAIRPRRRRRVPKRNRSPRRPSRASVSQTPGIGSRPAHCDAVQASPKRGSKLSSITVITASRSAMPPGARMIAGRAHRHRLRIGRAAVDRARRQAAERRRQQPRVGGAGQRVAPAAVAARRDQGLGARAERRARRATGGRRVGRRERAQGVEGRDRVTAIALHEKLAMSPRQRDRELAPRPLAAAISASDE